MGLHSLDGKLEAVVGNAASNWLPTDAPGFRSIQLEQFRHDERYHREISRLTVKERLTHMALHFAKYAGYCAEGLDEEGMRRLVTDVFVIGVSTVNSLNLRLYDLLLADGPPAETEGPAFGRLLTIQAGRMAAACEKLDHLESFSYRETIRDSAVTLVGAALSVARERGWDIEDLVRQRLQPVKEKSIFHGDL